jgi:hypothetical protein
MIPRRPINEAAHNDSWLPDLHLCGCTQNRRLRLSSRHGGAGLRLHLTNATRIYPSADEHRVVEVGDNAIQAVGPKAATVPPALEAPF